MVKILYKPTFIRQYKKLPEALKTEMKEKIELFQQDPHHGFLKLHKLQGRLKGFWSFSVNYEYRIIVQFETKDRVVLLAVGNHSIYQ